MELGGSSTEGGVAILWEIEWGSSRYRGLIDRKGFVDQKEEENEEHSQPPHQPVRVEWFVVPSEVGKVVIEEEKEEGKS